MQLSDYLALFPSASREKSRFMALAEAVLSQVMDLQNLVAQIRAGYSVGSARRGAAGRGGSGRGAQAGERDRDGRGFPAVPAGQALPLGLGRKQRGRADGALRAAGGDGVG